MPHVVAGSTRRVRTCLAGRRTRAALSDGAVVERARGTLSSSSQPNPLRGQPSWSLALTAGRCWSWEGLVMGMRDDGWEVADWDWHDGGDR